MKHGVCTVLLLAGFIMGAVAQTNSPPTTNVPVAAVTNEPISTPTNTTVVTGTNAVVAAAATNAEDKVELRYQRLLKQDDEALAETQKMINKANAQQGSDLKDNSEEEMRQMIQARVGSVKRAYQDFLRDNPRHVKAMIAYGSFLCDIQEEEEGVKWWFKAREIDPKNAAVHNNLANHYSHDSNPKRAIEEYETAIALQPSEPTYYFNLGNMMYLFRKETGELKKWTEEEVYEHSLEAFRKARDLEPGNYEYAYAYAETFYGVKNPNWQRALDAWDYCLKLNVTPLQRDQIYTHLARINIRLGKIKKARGYLELVKSEQWQDLRQRLTEIANHQEAILKVDDGKIKDAINADTMKADFVE